MHGNKLIQNAEFDYKYDMNRKGSAALRPHVDRINDCYNKKQADPFTNYNTIGY